MRNITVYDIDECELNKIANDNDTSVAEIVEMLMFYVEEMKEDNELI